MKPNEKPPQREPEVNWMELDTTLKTESFKDALKVTILEIFEDRHKMQQYIH